MMIARLHLPIGRSLLDFLRRHELFAELMALFRTISHREPAGDTSIAWEDGEGEDERRQ